MLGLAHLAQHGLLPNEFGKFAICSARLSVHLKC
jgi:hypothetical protein